MLFVCCLHYIVCVCNKPCITNVFLFSFIVSHFLLSLIVFYRNPVGSCFLPNYPSFVIGNECDLIINLKQQTYSLDCLDKRKQLTRWSHDFPLWWNESEKWMREKTKPPWLRFITSFCLYSLPFLYYLYT